MSRRASILRCAAVVLGLAALYATLPFTGRHGWLGGAIGLLALGATVPVVLQLSRAVLMSNHPVQRAIESTTLLVVMLIVGFGAAYVSIDDRAGEFDGLETRLDSIYFTVTTLSTVGFGDITAEGQLARGAVTIQILFDLSVLAIAFRLMSTAARRALDHEGGLERSSTPGR